jgi:multicomponent Na+:H+ antiporter subunit G
MVDVIGLVLVAAGVAILAVSTLGVVIMEDFFSRAHTVAKSETLGILLTLVGLILYQGIGDGSAQLVVVLVIALIANPVAVHALARAAVAAPGAVASSPADAADDTPPPPREDPA